MLPKSSKLRTNSLILEFKLYIRKKESNLCLKLYRKTYKKNLMYAKHSEDEVVKQEFNEGKKLAKNKVKDCNDEIINVDWRLKSK